MRFKFILLLACMIPLGCGDNFRAGSIGEACEVNMDCEGDRCLNELGEPDEFGHIVFPDGMCTQACSFDDADAGSNYGCPAGDLCIEYTPGGARSGDQFCLPGCETDRDCRVDYVCFDFSSPFEDWNGACVPPSAVGRSFRGPNLSRILY